MRTGKLLIAAIVAGCMGVASAASAVTFNLSGGSAFSLPSNYNPSPGFTDLGPGTTVYRNATLALDGPGRVTFSYGGSEAGYSNRFTAGTGGFHNKSGGNTPFTLDLGAGTLPFSFSTDSPSGSVANGQSSGFFKSIALYMKSPTLVYALFNDSARVDYDYDDMVVRMDVAPVPLPAAAWLLIGGIGAIGAFSRRRKAVA